MDEIANIRKETKSYMFEMAAYFKRKELFYALELEPDERRSGEPAARVDVKTKPLN